MVIPSGAILILLLCATTIMAGDLCPFVELTDPSGSFSPDTNTERGPDCSTCPFLIQVPETSVITITFRSMTCPTDIIQVYQGASTAGRLLATVTMQDVPTVITVTVYPQPSCFRCLIVHRGIAHTWFLSQMVRTLLMTLLLRTLPLLPLEIPFCLVVCFKCIEY